MAEVGTKMYLGDTEIYASGLALGDMNVQLNSIKQFDSFTTQSLLFWYDSSFGATTSSWIPRIGSAGGNTATIGSRTALPTINPDYGGVYTVTSASYINFNKTGSASQFYTGDYTAIIIGRQSGSADIQHGRLLNSQTNWFLGTYEQSPEYQSSYYANSKFIIQSSSIYDNDWRFYVGTRNGTTGSYYQNGYFVTSSFSITGNSDIFFPLTINDGAYQNGTFGTGERTNCEIGDVLFYSRALTDAEIYEAYYVLSQRYRFNQ
jgi:hypothetical protein